MAKNKAYFFGNPVEGSALIELFVRINIALEIRSTEKFLKEKNKKSNQLILIDHDFFKAEKINTFWKLLQHSVNLGGKTVVLSSQKHHAFIAKCWKQKTIDYIVKPYNQRELIARINAINSKKKRIVCLGGGTGLFTLLTGIKTIPNILLTSVVIMSDDGGSSGRLRASFGILPPGDIRRSLVALSNAPEVMNQIIKYRFKRGGEFKDHSFGNLFLTVLSEIKGSMSEAVRALGDILNIQGIVLPVTNMQTKLIAKFENGLIVRGESKIDLCSGRKSDLQIKKLWIEPQTSCDLDAYASILHADLVILGPGDLYTSIIANLVISKITEALKFTKAKKVYLCNLMTKPGETKNYFAEDHVREIIKYLGDDYLDYILISIAKYSKKSLQNYAKLDQYPVLIENQTVLAKLSKAKIILADLADQQELVRHDSEKTKKEIEKIIKQIH